MSGGAFSFGSEYAIVMWIADADRSREIDRLARERFGIETDTLMERAGHAAFHALLGMLPARRRIAIVCGKGNNGGDGLVVARLARAQGLSVMCLVAAEEHELGVHASKQLLAARQAGVIPIFAGSPGWLADLRSVDLIVDALLGTGMRGEVQGPVREAILAIGAAGVPVLSVDVPSGIDCDTGAVQGVAVKATRTVTFGLPKPLFFQGAGVDLAGDWSVADIGFPAELLSEPTGVGLLDREWIASTLPTRQRSGHKGEHGRVLIVAGSLGMRGAAALSALGALAAGAGLVTVAAIPSVCDAVAVLVPEATLLPLADAEGTIAGESAVDVLQNQERFDAAVFGPGLTTAPGVRSFLAEVWSDWRLPSCIDADALNLAAEGLALPEAARVLTPHPGEMARLVKSTTSDVQADRFGAARRLAIATPGAILLKGAYSLIASQGQPLWVNPTGNAGMGSGGMGDVLSGVVGALLAQGLGPEEAAACGAFWHGQAGDLCGPHGFTASQLAAKLPEARAKIVSA